MKIPCTPGVMPLFGLLGLLLLGGCISLPTATSQPTRFFLLNVPEQELDEVANLAELPPQVVLTRLDLPGYLRSLRMARYDSAHEIHYSDFNRWAEHIEPGLGRVLERVFLATGLDLSLPPSRSPRSADAELLIDVIHFEPRANGQVRLEMRYTLLDPEGELLLTGLLSGTESYQKGDYESIAAAMSEVAARLGREMAQAVSGVLEP